MTPRRRSRCAAAFAAAAVLAALVPGLSASAQAGSLVSDDFSAGSLGAVWSVVDPVGDGSVALVGQGTADARLSLGVPGGVSHNPVEENRALRVMQGVADEDFVAVAKFDSVPGSKYQQQGLLVEGDAGNWLRFDVHHDGTRLRAYVGQVSSGSFTTVKSTTAAAGSSVWLRVARVGSSWSFATSADGVSFQSKASFSRALDVSRVGVFAGNYSTGSAPGFTALVDYVFEAGSPVSPEDPLGPVGEPDVVPPVVSGVSVSEVGPGSARVLWSTDEPATSVVALGTSAALELPAVSVPGLRTSHSVVLEGLSPETGYVFVPSSVDAAGNVGSGAQGSFQTTAMPPGPTGSLVSDDFSAGSLGAVWSVVDPVGDGSVALVGQGTADARLSLGVPGGVSHNPAEENRALRVMQGVADEDFVAVAKFDSVPGSKYQQQGLLVEGDAGNWLRFDVHHDGTRLRAYVGQVQAGSFTTVKSTTAAAGSSVWLRVARVGSSWSFATSADGVSFQSKASFSRALDVSRVGVFAGNYSTGSAPGFTALVDYVFEAGSPVSPEDPLGPVGEPDVVPPVVSGVSVSEVGPGSARVLWSTDEPATSVVALGTSAALELPAVSVPGLRTSHSVVLEGLSPETGYVFVPSSVDAAGNVGSGAQGSFQTTAMPPGPDIQLWGGTSMTIGGSVPITQRWVNVTGAVSHPAGVASLHASLNGGPERALSIGPNLRRLVGPGDFNADFALEQLLAGNNTVVLRATALGGGESERTVTIDYTPGDQPFSARTVSWGAQPVGQVSHAVDGQWVQAPWGVRIARPGYDRLLAVGDRSWNDYEVTVPLTVHGYAQPGPNSGSPAVGMLLRWNGHNGTVTKGTQPLQGYLPDGASPTPFGAYVLFRNRFELRDHRSAVKAADGKLRIGLGETWLMKVRVETLPGGSTRYSARTWRVGQPEPTTFQLTHVAGTEDHQPPTGSIVLLAHEADVTFGDVQIAPVGS